MGEDVANDAGLPLEFKARHFDNGLQQVDVLPVADKSLLAPPAFPTNGDRTAALDAAAGPLQVRQADIRKRPIAQEEGLWAREAEAA
jgi:hypothetical protein